MQHTKYTLMILLVSVLSTAWTQETDRLSKRAAAAYALEHNYGIKMARNTTEIAKNNASIFNSGYLPTISGTTGATYSNSDQENTLQNGTVNTSNQAVSEAYQGSLSLQYTLFDGFGRKYQYRKLKETYQLSELEAQTVIENVLLQVFAAYYEVARLTEATQNIAASTEISAKRLKRVEYGYAYGQYTRLDVLNATVDLNTDNINLANTTSLLTQAKHQLNLLLGREVSTAFRVETQVDLPFSFDLVTLLEQANAHNVALQKVNQKNLLSALDIKISRSGYLPRVQLSSSYQMNHTINDGSFNYADQRYKGFNGGVQLSWNLFDGGRSKTRIQNAKIYADNTAIEKEAQANELAKEVSDALTTYENALQVLSSQEKILEASTQNFQRTQEAFERGQVNSIAFRQAQLNLLEARSGLNTATFEAKNAELRLHQLTGALLDNSF
ncbi:MAG: TolC family protein [Lutibacter sp.]|jgi:outer membrane protein TolC|nr:TolC family protein [Lutibacter sp.]